jgi:hypothetical protein
MSMAARLAMGALAAAGLVWVLTLLAHAPTITQDNISGPDVQIRCESVLDVGDAAQWRPDDVGFVNYDDEVINSDATSEGQNLAVAFDCSSLRQSRTAWALILSLPSVLLGCAALWRRHPGR